MKKIVFIITFISSISCYSQVQDEYQESNFQGQEEVSQHDPKVDLINSSSVGQTIKIGNLEIMKKDLGFFNWDDANAGISALGGGWRLPTKKELFILNVNKKLIGGFDAEFSYWSSTYDLAYDDGIWCVGITNSKTPNVITSEKIWQHNVRAVRTISPTSQNKTIKTKQ
jgi:hypothetical protein